MEGTHLFPVEDGEFEGMLTLFNTDQKGFYEDVKTLREWMKTQPHLPEVLDENRIRNFLLLNKCSIEESKKKIDMYYTVRSLISDIFTNANPRLPNMKRVPEIMYCIPLPKLTKEMYRVIIFKMRNIELAHALEPIDTAAYIFNMFEIRMNEDCIIGDVIISDMQGMSMTFFMKLSPAFFAKLFAFYEKVYTIRTKALYVINSHPFIYKLQAMLKTILKPKLLQRLHILEQPSDLFNYFPRDILPKEYGGLGQNCEEIHGLVQTKFDQYKDRFDKLDAMKVNEQLRPQQLKNDEVLGFYGNFKQLSVD